MARQKIAVSWIAYVMEQHHMKWSHAKTQGAYVSRILLRNKVARLPACLPARPSVCLRGRHVACSFTSVYRLQYVGRTGKMSWKHGDRTFK
ncbi:hypothetical protein V5799_032483 [Amblyomma americanum]|uniref:Uncharacterized protein n=1 Tax=Amblyomma americanum TaxID=6943 RepID=A0AAQ4DR21_AMBAM